MCRMMNLWVALADGGAVASYNPVSGKQLAKVGFHSRSRSHSHQVAMIAEITMYCI